MLRRTLKRYVRNPVPDDTKAFYTWFSGQAYRTEVLIPGGYPSIRIWPSYGKRWATGNTIFAFFAGVTLWGVWRTPDKNRYLNEIETEMYERNHVWQPYQQSEINLRYLVGSYKRHRYEKELIMDKGYVGLTSEFRKFFYHDDVWRPEFHDVFDAQWQKFGGPFTGYNWCLGYT